MEYVYLGRHVLASLGLDNQELMTAARSRLGREVDVPGLLKDKGYDDNASANPKNASIQCMIQKRIDGSTFHTQGGVDLDCLVMLISGMTPMRNYQLHWMLWYGTEGNMG